MTDLQHIYPGRLYRLTQDVENPRIDRRRADYMHVTEVFPKDSIWVVYREEGSVIMVARRPMKSGAGFIGGTWYEGKLVPPRLGWAPAWAKAILPHLTEVPLDTLEHVFLFFNIDHNRRLFQNLIEQEILDFPRLVKFLYDLNPEMRPDGDIE